MLQANGKINVKSMMDTWVLQMGYPVININLDRTTAVVDAKQERFLYNPRGTNRTAEFLSPYGLVRHTPCTERIKVLFSSIFCSYALSFSEC